MHIKANTHNLEQRIDACLAKLKETRPGLTMSWHWVEVQMSHRMHRMAGRVKFYRNQDRMVIEFSESLFANMTEQEKTGTVAHELAHAINFRLPETGDNHNAGWKYLCKDLGGDGTRLLETHAKVKRNVVKRVVLADQDKNCAMTLTTARRAERLMVSHARMIRLGCLAMDWNDKTYKWASWINDDLRVVAVLKESAGWKLVS